MPNLTEILADGQIHHVALCAGVLYVDGRVYAG